MKSRPFTYNNGNQIPGTEKFGNLTVGIPTNGYQSTNLQWWNGPDEDLGYVVAKLNVDENGNGLQPTPIEGVFGNVGFNRTKTWLYSEFLDLVNSEFGQNFTNPVDAKVWLESNSKWTSFIDNLQNSFRSRVLTDGGEFESIESLQNIIDLISTSLINDATIIVTPNGYKFSKLYSIKPVDGSGDFSSSISTSSTRRNSTGDYEFIPYNQVDWSEEMNQSYWIKADGGGTRVTVVPNQEISPRGDLTADLVIPTTGFMEHSLNPNVSTSTGQLIPNSGSFLTWQIHVKPAGYNFFVMRTNMNSIWSGTIFNLSNGTVVSTHPNFISSNIETLSNGWFLLTVITNNVTINNFQHFPSPNGSISFSGDGISGVYMWGCQIIGGIIPRPYQKTELRNNFPILNYVNGKPRLRLEPQRTNFMLNSSTFRNTWGFSTLHEVIDDLFFMSSGKKMRVLVNDNINSNASSMCVRNTGSSTTNIIASGQNCLSFFVKKTSEHGSIGVWGFLSGGSYDVNFDVNTGNVTRPLTSISTRFTNRRGGVVPLGNNLFYCWDCFTSDATYTVTIGFSPTTSGSNLMVPGQEISIAGIQMERGPNPTSFIPTGTATSTRGANTYNLNSISQLIGQTTGTIFIKGSYFGRGSIFRISDTPSLTNLIGLFIADSLSVNSGRIEYAVRKNNIMQSNATFNTLNNQVNKNIIIKYSQNQIKVFINGTLFWTYNYPIPTDFSQNLNRIEFGSLTENATADIDFISMWDYELSDQQCINLTI